LTVDSFAPRIPLLGYIFSALVVFLFFTGTAQAAPFAQNPCLRALLSRNSISNHLHLPGSSKRNLFGFGAPAARLKIVLFQEQRDSFTFQSQYPSTRNSSSGPVHYLPFSIP
jgi:hypothetical protein